MTGAADRAARLARYGTASTALALLGDRRVDELVNQAPVIGTGIGGTAALLHVEGVPVFAKRVPLTDLERRPEHVMSTANLFRLPTFCHYGVGSAGGGVWRELAAQTMTTNWVLADRNESFPLMYHWRVLPGPPARTPSAEEQAESERTVAYWHGSPAVRERLTALAQASASVVLFLEYVPQNLHEWLTGQLARGADALGAACAMVERGLRTDVAFMNANGLMHFDAHFRNILTDGRRLYFADFGLATSSRFELSGPEIDFLGSNRSHDASYTLTQLVNWLVTALTAPPDPAARNAYIRRCAEGAEPVDLPPSVAPVVKRYAPVAVAVNEFYWRLYGESRATPYPVEEIERVCVATGLELPGRCQPAWSSPRPARRHIATPTATVHSGTSSDASTP